MSPQGNFLLLRCSACLRHCQLGLWEWKSTTSKISSPATRVSTRSTSHLPGFVLSITQDHLGRFPQEMCLIANPFLCMETEAKQWICPSTQRGSQNLNPVFLISLPRLNYRTLLSCRGSYECRIGGGGVCENPDNSKWSEPCKMKRHMVNFLAKLRSMSLCNYGKGRRFSVSTSMKQMRGCND